MAEYNPGFDDTMKSLKDEGVTAVPAGDEQKQATIAKVMEEFKAGRLKDPKGNIVKDEKIAMAIASSMAEEGGQPIEPPPKF